MSTMFELSALAKDAFCFLQGAVEIRYRGGSIWSLEEDQIEFAVVNRLRAASMVSLLEDPEEVHVDADKELVSQLKIEREVNQRLRDFLVDLEAVCHEGGMSKETTGREVLSWLRGRIA